MLRSPAATRMTLCASSFTNLHVASIAIDGKLETRVKDSMVLSVPSPTCLMYLSWTVR